MMTSNFTINNISWVERAPPFQVSYGELRLEGVASPSLLPFLAKSSPNHTPSFAFAFAVPGFVLFSATTSSIRLGSLRAGSGRSTSLRSGSTSVWRNSGMDVFSRSSREEDDEEALKWASLEKLPTFDRLRKGLLFGSRGPSNEVDVDDLGSDQRQHLLDRLVKVADEDNEKFLLKLRNRIDRVGIDLPTIEVKFEHLTVEADVNTGSRALPSFINFHIDIFEGFLSMFHLLPNSKKHITILDDVSGVVKPSRMTLLLGPPSSGKTTLLLALGGKLAKELKNTGKVTYNGHELHEFVPERTAAYISQNDVHIGELTVRETLAFSARCQGVGSRYEMLAELSRREKDANIKPDPDIDVYMKAAAVAGQEASVVTDYTLKILGLDICADTMVGDQMVRGISGGQKKRVTTGEMIVGPSKVLLMDEISTGLDSSTTFQIVKSLKQFLHILEGTAVISLLQPAPETYDLFDDIILLTDGKIVYQGPREHVLEFFESMGFKCPERKGVADFLQEVTSKKDQQQYWMRRDQAYRFVTAKEFADAYKSFHVGRKMEQDITTPYDKTKSHPAALTTEKYGINKKELLKACTDREILLMKRNSFIYIFKLFQLFVLSFIALTLFFRTEMHRRTLEDGGIYIGALFFGVMMITFNGMAEISMTIAKLPVFYKQRDYLFYPSWAYAIPGWVVKIPISFIESALWTILTYYNSSGLFRFIGALGRNMIVANTFGSFTLLIIFALGGFVIVREDIKKWWIWGYWSSPMMYAMNGIVVNEFLGNQWKRPMNGTTLGKMIITSGGFYAEAYWYWISIAAMVGFTILFNVCFALCLAILGPFGKTQSNAPAPDSDTAVELTPMEDGQAKKKGMILPFEPHSITFNDVKYSVDMPQEMKEQGVSEDRLLLLKGVSGAFRPGVLTALMGVSGAGKTTLMDVLAGRKTGGYIEGDIRISGYPKVQETFARISGYCEQNDIHSPHVTVYESLLYSAWLRLATDVDETTRKSFVEEVMDLVELNPLREALVGLPGVNGLSTEQRKRLTIAVELVANPSIIFMDEPTSGLDARAAAIVMRTVRNTVDTGRTVVCTIHQPSIDIFEAFDELFLMKRGGQELYAGPVGRHSCDLIKYFEDINGVSKIKDGYNPATWMLEVSASAQEMALGVDFTEIYQNSDLYRRNKALIAELSVPRAGTNDLYFPTQYSQSFLVQCMACLWKQRWSYWRNPPYTAVRFAFTIFIALSFGTMFWDFGSKKTTQRDLANAMGSMYAATLFLGIQNAGAVQPVADIERTVFYRERAAGMYSALPYAFAQILVEIPYIFAQSAVYSVIVYAMIGFDWTVAKFFWYLFFQFCSLLYFTYYGLMTVAITPNANIAAIIAYSFYGLFNVFSGFIIPRPRIPVWWRWYYWGNPLAWTIYGMVASQFGDFDTVLSSGETVKDYLRRLGSLRASSLRSESTSVWRNSGRDVFSRSSREEDDEEALKWASLERLPTFDRLKKGLLFGSEGPSNEIDINDLGSEQRQQLLDRLVRVADEDNESFLLKLRNRIDRVGIDLPTIEVKFEHLTVEADVNTGSRALPSFINFHIDIFEGFLSMFHLLPNSKKHITILDDVSGVVKPSRMTLLLGPPSSGKTTLLLALGGKLAKELKNSGKVTYNGHELHEFVPERTAAYISQNDVHIGELTVRETLAFSARCQGVGSRYEMLAELCRREKDANIKPDPDIDIFMKAAAVAGQEASVVTDYTLKILGLDICADTMVGDQMVRGISGGQKKRVTTGEMVVGPSNVLLMDEISTGLDSSTTFQIVKSLKQFLHILEGTAVISLLQPAPETYDLFDDIILLTDGKIVYQGPREHVLEFFESMGFKCPGRKGVADFLQEVTSTKDQQQYWARRDQPYRFVTAKEFAKAYELFHVGRKMVQDTTTPYAKAKSHPAALTTEKYGLNKKELLKACVDREILLMKRNSFIYIFKLFQLTVISFITMTLFFRTEMHRRTPEDGAIYVGALFFGIIMITFNGMSEISMTIAKLPVFYKQRDYLFYPSWAYALPSWLVKIPISFIEAALWTILTYYVVGFDPNVTRFFKHYLILLFVNQMSSGLFRFIGAFGRNMIVANTFGSFALLLVLALGGFILVRDDVKKWWLWGYWSSPMMYAMNGIVVNEFLGNKWKTPWNNTGINDTTLGIMVIKSGGFYAEAYWYWIAIAALFGFIVVFNLCFALSLAILGPFGKTQSNAPAPDSDTGGVELSAMNDGGQTKKKGMILPFEPHSITFNDVKYSVDMPQEMREQGVTEDKLLLLKGVSGAFRPGVLTALMGVSGAGKTTLMDVLAGRKTGGYIEGDIRISGYPKVQETFARISGYCEQNDIHSPHVTVYESLLYSAWLRLATDVDESTRKSFVEEVMDLVELNPLREALVGLPGVNGLSTEQRKRLTIAVELVANPSIIFMDEPTSGLDARAAAIVMRTVRNTVDTGRTVVCTIHQPSIDIFEAFDELFLMKRGGQELYAGPVGRHSCELIKYFEDINGVSKIKDGYNPATWMLEVSASAQEMALGVDFTEIYQNSDLYRRNKALIAELSVPRPGTNDLYFPTQYSQSFLVQCKACLWKQRWSYWRNPPYTAVRFVFTTFIALAFGTMFWDLGSKRRSQRDLANAMGSMYAATLFLGIQNASAVQPVVDIERTVFYRERAAGMYSALPYAFAQVLVEIPYIFAQSVVYCAIVYAMIGFDWTAAKFLWYLFFQFCCLLYMTYYGMMTVAITPNAFIAAVIAGSFYGLFNVFSGFIIPRPVSYSKT
ncbi:hypothetical protein LXL04_032104 [Taraxacum kok-saghyz]